MVFDFPNNTNVQTYIGGMGTTGWNTWTKPKGFSNAIIIGCGGGGSGGYDVGSSGGAGGFGHIYCPLLSLPDTLYIQVGAGALAADTASGGATYISTIPSTAYTLNILMTCGPGTGGRRLGIPGNGGGISFGILTPGVYMGFSGSNGIAGPGGVGDGQPAPVPSSGSPIYGGASGSWSSGNGKWMTSPQSWFIPLISSALGCGGFIIKKPFISFGGGGGQNSFPGGAGGAGFFGSGGGGAGRSGANSIGGDGFVIIICY
jgi:hypothetical protein